MSLGRLDQVGCGSKMQGESLYIYSSVTERCLFIHLLPTVITQAMGISEKWLKWTGCDKCKRWWCPSCAGRGKTVLNRKSAMAIHEAACSGAIVQGPLYAVPADDIEEHKNDDHEVDDQEADVGVMEPEDVGGQGAIGGVSPDWNEPDWNEHFGVELDRDIGNEEGKQSLKRKSYDSGDHDPQTPAVSKKSNNVSSSPSSANEKEVHIDGDILAHKYAGRGEILQSCLMEVVDTASEGVATLQKLSCT